jgi:hypothetical protein
MNFYVGHTCRLSLHCDFLLFQQIVCIIGYKSYKWHAFTDIPIRHGLNSMSYVHFALVFSGPQNEYRQAADANSEINIYRELLWLRNHRF